VRGTHRTSSPVDGVADRGANAGRDGRACGKREEGARRLLKPTGGGGGERGGGVWPWGFPEVWGLAPTATQAQCTRAARLCFGQGRAEAADGWAPVAVGAGGRGEARAARVGRSEKKKGWSSPDEQYGFEFI
jgi:hypothetical protein